MTKNITVTITELTMSILITGLQMHSIDYWQNIMINSYIDKTS